jgi:LuxR family maltose regulon positive regulatory protein
MQGRPESAARLLEPIAPAGDEAMLWWLEVPSVTRCRVGIAQGSPAGLQEARERLRELAGQAESRHNTCHLIELSILQAVVCEKQGKAKEALRFLERAVTLARPGGFVFLFWELGPVMAGMLERLEIGGEDEDFIRRLLAAFVPGGVTPSTEVASAQPAEPSAARRTETLIASDRPELDALTQRELDVLELLAQRFQNKEISERLFISTHTVNDHLKHIYQKLQVTSRREAVNRAVEMGIVNPRSSG